ncbi:GntR family transcriptional regulator [Amycolatopsis magusensis]|uniref:GntR family transcriptional regulator n=1 Tax=Amycolatopsis magusensis TaxID=882444 RepID=UPI003C308BB1
MAPRDFRPVYQRVLDDLQAQITGGELAPGDALPSEEELADKYGVSRTSVRGAVRILRDAGIVEVRRPLGTFVRKQPVRTVRAPSERYQWEKDRALKPLEERLATGTSERESGLDTPELEFNAKYTVVPATDRVASALKIAPGSEVLQRVYVTSSKDSGTAIGGSESYIPLELLESNPKLLDEANEPWPGGTHHQLSTVGIEIESITDNITARMPSTDEKDSMKIPDGTPVFEIQKLSTDTLGRKVECSFIVLPGDRAELEYTVRLDRWEAAPNADN